MSFHKLTQIKKRFKEDGTDEFYIVLTDSIIEELNLHEGDLLLWEILNFHADVVKIRHF